MKQIDKLVIDINDPEASADYDLDDNKIYGYHDSTMNKTGIIKRIQTGLWHNVVISGLTNRWNDGRQNPKDLFDNILRYEDCEIWEFDTDREYLQWALDKLNGRRVDYGL